MYSYLLGSGHKQGILHSMGENSLAVPSKGHLIPETDEFIETLPCVLCELHQDLLQFVVQIPWPNHG
jgi:hypothetical protein